MAQTYVDSTRSKFQMELEHLINRYSLENDSNTPDYVLAEYLNSCLQAYNEAIKARTTHQESDKEGKFPDLTYNNQI